MSEQWAFIATCDLVAQVRGRSAPYQKIIANGAGVGWVPADLAMSAFGAIADPNPFGSLGDLRLVPDLTSEITLPKSDPLVAATKLILANQRDPELMPWASCPRTFLEAAIARLNSEFGVEVMASFEHEFVLTHADGRAISGLPFGFDAYREVEEFGAELISLLTEFGYEPESFLPEYGKGQFEVTIAPTTALIAADRAILLREIVRDTAKRCDMVATFAPLTSPDGVGNGVHVHLSLWKAGKPMTYEAGRQGDLSALAESAFAGILKHAQSLVAFTAPSQISFMRLQPHRWSAGGICIAKENREALLRICPQIKFAHQDQAKSFNVEYRAADATANPWIVLGALIHAMTEGLRLRLVIERVIDAELDTVEGITPLPESLEKALEYLSRDLDVQGWFDPDMLSTFIGIRASEAAEMKDLTPEERCARYVSVY